MHEQIKMVLRFVAKKHNMKIGHLTMIAYADGQVSIFNHREQRVAGMLLVEITFIDDYIKENNIKP